jgi:phage shock protein A
METGELTLFDNLRGSIDDLLQGRVAPADRMEQIHQMKQGLVMAKVATDDLRAGVALTRARLERERTELATVRRRGELAAGIADTETVAVAQRFESQHAERVSVLERKLDAQEAEAMLAEREIAEMTAQLKAASKGVGDVPAPRGPTDAELGLRDDAPLAGQLNELRRTAERAERERAADDRLAELKKKMGR